MQGGYRVSNELKEDLIKINRVAEINKSIADVADMGKRDKNELINNTNKIKKIAEKWLRK